MKTLTELVPSVAAALSGKSTLRKIWLILKLTLFAVVTKKISREFKCSLQLCYSGKKFILQIYHFSDLMVLSELFVDREYEWDVSGQINTIIDLGAHWGNSAIYYALTYPEAHIYAVEPDPKLFARLEKIAKQFSNITPVNAAVYLSDGQIQLNIDVSTLGNSLSNRKTSVDRVAVKSYEMGSLLKHIDLEKADLIKFDIEGSEEFMFSVTRPSNLARYFIGEVHDDLMSTSAETFFDQLSEEGTYTIDKHSLPKAGRWIVKASS